MTKRDINKRAVWFLEIDGCSTIVEILQEKDFSKKDIIAIGKREEASYCIVYTLQNNIVIGENRIDIYNE